MARCGHRAVLVIATATLVLCGCRTSREHSAKRLIRLVMSTNYPSMPVVLAPVLGFYDDESLDVQIEHQQNNARAVHALAGGSADVSTGSFSQILALAAEGRDIKAFTLLTLGPQQVLVAHTDTPKNIRRVQDLRDAAIGIAGTGGPGYYHLNWVLAKNGLSILDVNLVNIGTLGSAVAAVEHKKVDAAMMNASDYLMLRKKGVNPLVLVDLTRGTEDLGAVLMATGPWLREHGETARRFARAINRATRWMQQQSPDTVLEKLPARYQGGERDVALASIASILPMYSNTGKMTAEGAEGVKRMLSLSVESVRRSNFDLSKTYTNEFLPEP